MEEKIGFSLKYKAFMFSIISMFSFFIFFISNFLYIVLLKEKENKILLLCILTILIFLIISMFFSIRAMINIKTIYIDKNYFKLGKNGVEIPYKKLKYIYIYGKADQGSFFSPKIECKVLSYLYQNKITNIYIDYYNKKIKEFKEKIVDAEYIEDFKDIKENLEFSFKYKDKSSKIWALTYSKLAKKIFDYFEKTDKKIKINKEYLLIENNKYFFKENIIIKKSDYLLIKNISTKKVVKIKKIIIEQSGFFKKILKLYSLN